MSTTGSSSNVSQDIPELLARIRKHTSSPLAVGFNISTQQHFKFVAECGADGVVIGSRIINLIQETQKSSGNIFSAVKDFCANVIAHDVSAVPSSKRAPADTEAQAPPERFEHPQPISDVLPHTFGAFGGQYVPESLMAALNELEEAHAAAIKDPKFWQEFEGMYEYMGRPSTLYEAERLTEHVGGAKIWFKREDLNHTGSHKINNAIGQILLARRLGKTRVIAETGAGQHGVATATACARFGLECCIFMGEEDVRRQALNVFRMRLLGATVIPVSSGSKTLKDAVNEAMRDWVTNLDKTHFLIGSPIGPHPFPTIVRDFQKVIGREIKQQMQEKRGKLPDAVVACVGGGSNAIGSFHEFINENSVRLVGCEAGGDGVDTDRHSATLARGSKGVLHGVRTYLLQSKTGQVMETHSVSAGLDYPGVGPEHAFLKDLGRAEYVTANDEQALQGFRLCTQLEGIIPALESSHAVWAAVEVAKTMPKDSDLVLCLSGRGDKDVQQISELLSEGWAERLKWDVV